MIKRNLLPGLARPLDLGLTFRGERDLRCEQDLARPAADVDVSVLVVLLQAQLYAVCAFRSISALDYSETSWLALGLALGLGYSLSELPNSFVKRRLGIPPGGVSKRRDARPVRRRPSRLGDRRHPRARAVPLGQLGDAAARVRRRVRAPRRDGPALLPLRGQAEERRSLGAARGSDVVLAGARVLLTGATGRLGRCIAEQLVRGGCELVLVVRASSPEAARERIRAALPSEVDLGRVTALCGDVTEPGLGLGIAGPRAAPRVLDIVLHAAATTSFTSPLETARSTNVVATRNILAFAERATAAVEGRARQHRVRRREAHGPHPRARPRPRAAASRTRTSSRSTRRSSSSGATPTGCRSSCIARASSWTARGAAAKRVSLRVRAGEARVPARRFPAAPRRRSTS